MKYNKVDGHDLIKSDDGLFQIDLSDSLQSSLGFSTYPYSQPTEYYVDKNELKQMFEKFIELLG